MAKAGGKHSAVASVTQGVRPNLKCVSNHASVDVSTDDQSTSLSKYELSNQVMKDKEPPSNSVKKAPQEQTNDEWLQDYDNASWNRVDPQLTFELFTASIFNPIW